MANTKKRGALEDYLGNELLPKTDAAQVQTEDGKALREKLAAYDAHTGDSTIHVTADNKSAWNGKETPAGAQAKADAALKSAKEYADGLSTGNSTALTEHINDTGKHATAVQKVVTLTHSKAGTVHTLAGLPSAAGLYTAQFKAAANYAEGDTWADGWTAKPTGEEQTLLDNAFVAGDLVTVIIDAESKRLSFKLGAGKNDTLPPLLPNMTVEVVEGDTEDTYTVTMDKLLASPETAMLESAQLEWGEVMPKGPGKGEGKKTWMRGDVITYTQPPKLAEIEHGSILKLNENGAPVEFYIAKHDYESELNGAGRTLVVRKDCYDKRQWHTANVNAYATSAIDSWLNSTYKTLLDANIQEAMSTTKIRYTPGNGNTTVSTLERSVFLLSGTELGQSIGGSNVEGTVIPIASKLQVAHLNGSAVVQWTRSPSTGSSSSAVYYTAAGYIGGSYCNSTHGSRPAFTLPADLQLKLLPDGSYAPLSSAKTLAADEETTVSHTVKWPHGQPVVFRQFTRNFKRQWQTMLQGGVFPPVSGAGYSENFADNTWEQIGQACADNDPILDSWLVGDTKNEVINGETLTFAIVGKNIDVKADGSGKAPLTIGTKYLLANARNMNTAGNNLGSFIQSDMYKWLVSGVYEGMPSDLKSVIKEVNKSTSVGGGGTNIQVFGMHIWLFSEVEIFGTTAYSAPGEGIQYPYFTVGSNRIKRLANGNGEPYHWWERSPGTSGSVYFGAVNSSGEPFRGGAQTVSGVSFGFCI